MRDLSYLLGNLITRINSFSCNRHGLPWPLLVAADPWIHRAPSIQCTALRLGLIEMSKGGGAFVLCCRTDCRWSGFKLIPLLTPPPPPSMFFGSKETAAADKEAEVKPLGECGGRGCGHPTFSVEYRWVNDSWGSPRVSSKIFYYHALCLKGSHNHKNR